MASERPAFRGLSVHRNLTHRFSLLYPEEWVRQDIPQRAGGGALYYPDRADRATYLLVQSRRLRVRVRPPDLETLRAGLLDGLHTMTSIQIESVEARTTGDLLDLEAHHTYVEADAVRTRWLRLLYQGNLQVSLTAQGASAAAYTYWLPMFNTAMRTVRFADWWAEAIGVSWKRTLDKRDDPGEQAETGLPGAPGKPGGQGQTS